MRIDSHQHFWHYSAAEYPWITAGMEKLARDYLPADLAPLAAAAGVVGTVAVQARQSIAETRWLLTLAAEHPLIKGVVGWVDLQSAASASQLAEFAGQEKFVGVRHVVQDESDPEFLLRESFVRGLKQLSTHSLTYDLLVYPQQLGCATQLVQLLPEQLFVIDHLAKPEIANGQFAAWAVDMAAIARHKNVFCKVSGMVTQAAWRGWKKEIFTPYLESVLAAFGPERLLFGSDWPVCLLAGDYADVVAIVVDFCAQLSPSQQQAIGGGTAVRFYNLPTAPEKKRAL